VSKSEIKDWDCWSFLMCKLKKSRFKNPRIYPYFFPPQFAVWISWWKAASLQILGVDRFNTYSPSARWAQIRRFFFSFRLWFHPVRDITYFEPVFVCHASPSNEAPVSAFACGVKARCHVFQLLVPF